MQQKATEWTPNPNQCKVLDIAQKAGLERSITKICKEAGINRTTFYRWLKGDADFANAWDEVWRKSITRHMPSVVSAMIGKARKGDTAAARLVADLKGVIKQQHEHKHEGKIILQWEEDDNNNNA